MSEVRYQSEISNLRPQIRDLYSRFGIGGGNGTMDIIRMTTDGDGVVTVCIDAPGKSMNTITD